MSEPERAMIERPELVQFGTSFVKSEAFKELFREGMGLVEETASYLDGEGRLESRLLGRNGALAYASESMRLTTRLMQIASWLLVQRAVAEGEISSSQADREKDRVRLNQGEARLPEAEFERLPERLREIVGLSLRLQARVAHLDRLISAQAEAEPAAPVFVSPVAAQMGMLQHAFGLAS
jgi:regulator of CtrA degradation